MSSYAIDAKVDGRVGRSVRAWQHRVCLCEGSVMPALLCSTSRGG